MTHQPVQQEPQPSISRFQQNPVDRYQPQQQPVEVQQSSREQYQDQPVAQEQQGELLREDTRVFGSPWLSERLRGIPEDKWKAMCPPTRNVATDTFEYSMEQDKSVSDMKNQIGDLECELKIKQRELETNAFIEKELRRKLKNAEDAFQTKRQADEIEKQLDIQVRVNQDLTMENAKLMDQLAEMNRKLLAHQAEIDNLDRVIASKNALKEEELRAKLQAEIEQLRYDLDEKGRLLAKAHKEVTLAHAEVDRKQKEIELKDTRAMDLLEDLAHVRERLSDAETRHAEAIAGRTSAERERGVLQTVLDHKEPFNQTLERLTYENTELKSYIETLESRIKLLERDRQLAHELSQELREMHMAIQDRNVATLEKNKLSDTLQNVELLLKDKTAEEETLRKELIMVQQYIRDIEHENMQYRHHEGLLANSKERFKEAELKRLELVNQLAASQRRVRRLSSACVDRNRYLEAIISELAVFGPHPHGAKLQRLATDATRVIREELPLADPNDPALEEPLPQDLSDINHSELRLGNRHISGGSPGYEYRSLSASPSLKRDGTLDSIGSGHRYVNLSS
ncbi:hypothetical protein Ciccas_007652 [Cichlidogyrus casuarinus]|uniref:Uncharacterized protein n=1 Tax=Cichlidogyrus casuarinus TaxID=1844966 RepID=A0ABD2Q296_9PLAT